MRSRRAGRPGSRGPKPAARQLGSFRKNRDSESGARAAEALEATAQPREPRRFRVLVAVHRPRYRARTERAMRGFDWEVRSLLNKEDPVGKIQQQTPHIFVISDDFGRQKDLGILRAVQRFRESGMKVITLFEDEESADENADLCDIPLWPPYKTADVRAILTELHLEITGTAPAAAESVDEDAEDD